MEKIQLNGRLGFSLEASKEEFAVLTGSDREAAGEMLLQLVENGACKIEGTTYFPQNWNRDVFRNLEQTMWLTEAADRMCFHLPETPLRSAARGIGDTIYWVGKERVIDCKVVDYDYVKERDSRGMCIPGQFHRVYDCRCAMDGLDNVHVTFSEQGQLGKTAFWDKEKAEKVLAEKLSVQGLIADANVRSKETVCSENEYAVCFAKE